MPTFPRPSSLARASDVTFSSAPVQGELLFRGSSRWNNLAVAEAGSILTSGGTGADPLWRSALHFGAALSGGSGGGTYLGINAPSGYAGDFALFQKNDVTLWKVTGTGQGAHTLWDAAVNVVNPWMIFTHASAATPDDGFGGSLEFDLQTTAGLFRPAAEIHTLWAEAAHNTRRGQLTLGIWDTVLRVGLQIESTGTASSVWLPDNPPPSAVTARLLLGEPLVGSSSGGTFLGINAPTGFNGDLWHLQQEGNSLFAVDANQALEVFSNARIVKNVNNQSWLYQKSMDGVSQIELLYLDNTDTLVIAPQGGGTLVGGALAVAAGITLTAAALPADGALSPGMLALAFDSTDGAARLLLKGKSADGTVVTGEVALI